MGFFRVGNCNRLAKLDGKKTATHMVSGGKVELEHVMCTIIITLHILTTPTCFVRLKNTR